MIIRQGNHSSLALSVAFHAALALSFAYFAVAPVIQRNWYELEYQDPAELFAQELPVQTSGPESTQPGASVALPAAGNNQAENRETQAQPDQTASVATSGADQPETLVPPALSHESELLAQFEVGDNSPARSALSGLGSGDPASGGEVSYAVRGGNVTFSLPSGYKHSLGEPGSVTLRFKLDRHARPVSNSFEAIQQTSPRFFEAAKKALRDGSFRFRGAPEPGVTCMITLEFL